MHICDYDEKEKNATEIFDTVCPERIMRDKATWSLVSIAETSEQCFVRVATQPKYSQSSLVMALMRAVSRVRVI